jgi:dihydroorotase
MAPPAGRRSRRADAAPAPTELVLAGRGWVGGRLQPLEVGIDGEGRISAVGRDVRGDRRHDLGDRLLLPAATDLHVHLREPGPSETVETIPTGTQAAALGGVGLVGEMPNTEPPTTTVERLEDKAGRVRGRAAVDVLLFASPERPTDVPRLARRSGGFKLYLSPTTGIEQVPGADALAGLLEALASVELPVVAHAEEPALFGTGPSPRELRAWDAFRPISSEAAAVSRLLGAPPRLRLHIAHVTTAAIASEIRDRGLSFEASPHHLLLDTQAGADPRFKVNPPLRARPERLGLWTSFKDGGVPVLASDHAPHSLASKALPFELAPSGVPGVATMLPLLLAKVARGDLALPVLLASACDRPARFLGQPMGRLAVGHRANLLAVDFRRRDRVRAARIPTPCGWSPFEGFEAVFPDEHWRDGERIVQDREYVGRPTGTTVRPEYADRSAVAAGDRNDGGVSR